LFNGFELQLELLIFSQLNSGRVIAAATCQKNWAKGEEEHEQIGCESTHEECHYDFCKYTGR
jgi:hypothetical protein